MKSHRRLLTCLPLLTLSVIAAAQTTQPASGPGTAPSTATAPAAHADWLKTLNEGYAAAQQAHQPIVVVVGATWCPWCQKLNGELTQPAAQAGLKSWTRIYIDIDQSPNVARQLGVGPIPAIRILTPMGRIIASADGFRTADDFVQLLNTNAAAANPATIDPAVVDTPVDEAALPALLAGMESADTLTRETVIRKLLANPKVAAPAIVGALAKGKLAQRLSALDLLSAWHAPVDGLDPWRPASITPERLAALDAWSKTADAAIPVAATLPADQLADAKDQIRHLLAATSETDAQAIRERLVRFGHALLPAIYTAIKDAATDDQRDRLVALRYRLVASDALALSWPTGFDRLASSSTEIRHAALDELAQRARPADNALLLEMFSNPDGLVRETSLRLLRTNGGPDATAALINLLADPDPNVRAAVLKQFAEEPAPGIADQITAYAMAEKDPDLVVHAVRVLRAGKNTAGITGLYQLLKHPSWRVRAEACEGLSELIDGRDSIVERSDAKSRTTKDKLHTTLVTLLVDDDPFVVSRALIALQKADTIHDFGPIVAVGEKNPQLVPEIVKLLTAGQSNTGTLPYLVKYVANPDPAVRAAAARPLATAATAADAPKVQAALRDADSRVRLAAAAGIMDRLDALAIWSGSNSFDNRNEPVDQLAWLAGFQRRGGAPYTIKSGETLGRIAQEHHLTTKVLLAANPTLTSQSILQIGQQITVPSGMTAVPPAAWILALQPDLDSILARQDPAEKLAAARVLIALGSSEKALPIALSIAQENPTLRVEAFPILPWLDWDARATTFRTFKSLANEETITFLIRQISISPAPQLPDLLWSTLEDKTVTVPAAGEILTYLRQSYLGSNYYSSDSALTPQMKTLLAIAKDKAHAGPEMQRMVALGLLVGVSAPAAKDAAVQILDDPDAPSTLKLDALQIQLMSLPPASAQRRAVEVLSSTEAAPRKMALRFLVRGSDAYLRSEIYIYSSSRFDSESSPATGSPIMPQPPKGLTLEQAKPFLTDPDPSTAAGAAYLMALLKDPSGMDTLLKYFQANKDDSELRRQVYRAITAVDDESQLPLLTEIYTDMKKNREYELSEFYWTIRSMKGDKLAQFRKTIRTEVGMDRLR